jgi:hypothetical protein
MSEWGYEITLALYSACNARSKHRVAEVESLVRKGVEQRELEDREAGWLAEVIQSVRKDDWYFAEMRSREILRAHATESP